MSKKIFGTVAYLVLSGLVVLKYQGCGQEPLKSLPPSESSGSSESLSAAEPTFSSAGTVLISSKTCTSCHSGTSPSGGYDLSTSKGALAGNRVIPYKPLESTLIKRMRDGSMPPGKPLSEEQIKSVEDWIMQGAPPFAVAKAGPVNLNPVVDAGGDQFVSYLMTSANLSGKAADDDRIASVLWEQVSGATATINNPQSLQTTISNLRSGLYVFMLTVTDSQNVSASDTVQIMVEGAPPNSIPLVNAGVDRSVQLPMAQVVLAGTATDSDGEITALSWVKISGPNVTLSGTNTLTLTLSNLVEGSYVFRLTATDNGSGTSFDEVALTILPPSNLPPTVNAGVDQTVLSNATQVRLVGTAADSDGQVTSVMWTRLSGPNATLSGANTLNATLTNLSVGTYVYRLAATDNGGLIAFDDVQIIVNPAANSAPVVNAGIDQSITLPVNMLSLQGTATDSDGTISSVRWTQVAGPANVTFSAMTSLTTNVNGLLVAGTYRIQLSAQDNSGGVSVDELIITVMLPPNVPPIANAGADKSITLPTNSVVMNGSGTDSDGAIVAHSWRQTMGPSTATLTGNNTPDLTASNLVQGTYTFELRVTDNSSATAVDLVNVVVNPALVVNPNATFTWVYNNVLQPSCVSCHGAGGDAGVDLRTHTSTLRTLRVGNAAQSRLFTTINSGSMPDGAPKLSAEKINAVRDWINAGALNN